MKTLKNKQDWWNDISNEHIVWTIGVKKTSGINVKWLHGSGEKHPMEYWKMDQTTHETTHQRLALWNHHNTSQVKNEQGSPIQFVNEYFKENYPDRKDHTKEWKLKVQKCYYYLVRSLNLAYPEATIHGLVSISDMKEFDHDKYDMTSKLESAHLFNIIPTKLVKMVSVNQDEKMKEFSKEYEKIWKKYGGVTYDSFDEFYEKEKDDFPDRSLMPKIAGGESKIDILEGLKYLFRREKYAFELMLETYDEMKKNGELLNPKHMQ
eukprot:gene5342-9151_t